MEPTEFEENITDIEMSPLLERSKESIYDINNTFTPPMEESSPSNGYKLYEEQTFALESDVGGETSYYPRKRKKVLSDDFTMYKKKNLFRDPYTKRKNRFGYNFGVNSCKINIIESINKKAMFRKTLEGVPNGDDASTRQVKEHHENNFTRLLIYLTTEHEYLLQLIMLLPLILMSLYISLIEGGSLVRVAEG